MSEGRVAVAYVGVHRAFQLALAAQEIGELQALYCSLYDHPTRWGGRFGEFLGHGFMEGRNADGLDLDRAVEFPWPLLAKAAWNRVYPRGRDAWLLANKAFDAWAAHRIAATPPAVFVGTATADLHSLVAGKRAGAVLLHDCPGMEPTFEARLMHEAADRAGVRVAPRRRPWRRRDNMAERKAREYALADVLMVYSALQARGFESLGKKVAVTSSWVDTAFWRRRGPPRERAPGAPLKLLFVGALNLRKGIPFLLRAMALCGAQAELTIVGPSTTQTASVMAGAPTNVVCLPAQPQAALRATYEAHDMLVLPSVADTFGNVALEAMACGVPVIVTDNCGVPTPDPAWRVPAMDVEALAARIMAYADDLELAPAHGAQAATFASGFTPQAFRANVQKLYRDALEDRR